MADTNESKRNPLTIYINGNKNTPVNQQNTPVHQQDTPVEKQDTPDSDEHQTFRWAPHFDDEETKEPTTPVDQQDTPPSDEHLTFPWAPHYDEEETKEPTTPVSNYLTGVGAGLGAYGSYKGVGMDFFKPDPRIFAPKKINTVAPPATSSVSPEEYASRIANTGDGMSDVEHTMRSGQGRREGQTGRQREDAQHWESNRQSLAREQLKAPGASKVIVDTGPMYPTKHGFGVPYHVAEALENERLMAEAHAKVLNDAAELAKNEKLAKEAAEKLAAEQKAAQWAGIRSGVTKIGLGGLGGAFAAKDLYEAIDEMRARGIDDENIAKLLGGIGGGLMTIPTPLTEAGGAALVGGSMAWPYIREHFGYKQKH